MRDAGLIDSENFFDTSEYPGDQYRWVNRLTLIPKNR